MKIFRFSYINSVIPHIYLSCIPENEVFCGVILLSSHTSLYFTHGFRYVTISYVYSIVVYRGLLYPGILYLTILMTSINNG